MLDFIVHDGELDPSVIAGNPRYTPHILSSTDRDQELPKHSRVVSMEEHGISFWAQTGKINVELDDGTPISFFIKVLPKETGRNMVRGEFESMKELHTLLPELIRAEADCLGNVREDTRHAFFSTRRDLQLAWQRSTKTASRRMENLDFM